MKVPLRLDINAHKETRRTENCADSIFNNNNNNAKPSPLTNIDFSAHVDTLALFNAFSLSFTTMWFISGLLLQAAKVHNARMHLFAYTHLFYKQFTKIEWNLWGPNFDIIAFRGYEPPVGRPTAVL